jgi:hypothetical protein
LSHGVGLGAGGLHSLLGAKIPPQVLPNGAN